MPYGRKRYTRSRRTRSTTRARFSKAKGRYATRRVRSRRSRTTGKALTVRPKWINPLAQKTFVKFVWTDTGASSVLNVAGSYISDYVFSGNSIYDPNYTGVGTQPYGFDQYVGSTLYTSYRCPSSSIAIYARPEPTYASMRRLHVFILPNRQASLGGFTDIDDLRMTPFVKEIVYDGLTESTKGCKLKHYATTQAIQPEGYAANYSFAGIYNANPSYRWYWHVIFYTDTYTGAEEIDIYFDVKIKYYTLLARGYLPDES